jgi:hypothetical protein
MLPVIASIGFFIGVIRAEGSVSSAFAGAMFVLLALGVLGGALRVVRDAEQAGGRSSGRSRSAWR